MTILHTFCGLRGTGSATTAVALAVALACMAGQARGQTQPTAEAKSSRGVEARTTGQEERIRKIEATAVDIPMGEKEPVRLSQAQLMELYKVPGLSIAVIDDFK